MIVVALNRGVTISTWRAQGYDKNDDGVIDVKDLKLISAEDAVNIMRKNYWNRWRAGDIQDQSIANALVDWVWSSGKNGIIIPQQLLGVKTDSIVGPQTIRALNQQNALAFFARLQKRRLQYIDNIIKAGPVQREHKSGWCRRINSIHYGYLKDNRGRPSLGKPMLDLMTKQINLTFPKSWNQCTTAQLELIAKVMQEQILRQDRYHPFSMQAVKVAMFFVLSGIHIVRGVNLEDSPDKQFYLCRMASDKKQDEPFPIYLWQINYWLSPKARTNDKTSAKYIAQGVGLLDWLDNEYGVFLTRFPYPTIMRRHSWWRRKKVFQGAYPDMDGFSWMQYRFASDLMQRYMQISNNLVRMQLMNHFTADQMLQQADSVDLARSMFLATIFNAKTRYVDTNTGIVKRDFHYEIGQDSANAPYFRHFPDTDWQVILFWWTGMMHTLSKRFPHVFKVRPTNRQNPSAPLEIYTATTVTMQKYAGLTEDQVNNQSYSLVLEHLERLSKENEEMEKIRNK